MQTVVAVASQLIGHLRQARHSRAASSSSSRPTAPSTPPAAARRTGTPPRVHFAVYKGTRGSLSTPRVHLATSSPCLVTSRHSHPPRPTPLHPAKWLPILSTRALPHPSVASSCVTACTALFFVTHYTTPLSFAISPNTSLFSPNPCVSTLSRCPNPSTRVPSILGHRAPVLRQAHLVFH